MSVLLSTAYFPPIQYFAAMSREAFSGLSNRTRAVVYIEACENYQKQSYRNRCNFYAASGQQSLCVPVVHEGGTHTLPISKIKIDHSAAWLQQHERAIISAYRSSAFFEYYKDELFEILDSRPEKLWDLNLSLIRFFLDKLGLPVDVVPTGDYVMVGESIDDWDLREVIHPKRPDTILESLNLKKPYFQVFAQKHGFIPNLSIMDLLFNEGPNAISFLI